MDSVAQRLAAVRERIRAAEANAGRPPGTVRLLAVSKTQPPEKLKQAIAAGQRAFGENYLQEALYKMQCLTEPTLEWHFIGRIQSNKTRVISENFTWIHSLCDLKHARRLSHQRPDRLPPLNACVQVNISGEPSKAGLLPEMAGDFLDRCQDLHGLSIRGLMSIPAASAAAPRRPFRELRELRDRLATPTRPLDTLSMGMSADLEAAIAEGATLVRIGTAIFGPRQYRDA